MDNAPDSGLGEPDLTGLSGAEYIKEQILQQRVKVTGEQNKIEAVKIIQRLLVDMGYSVKNKGVVNPVDSLSFSAWRDRRRRVRCPLSSRRQKI